MTTARRRLGFDARLFVGLGLVAASVAGVIGIVAAMDRRVTVYAAAGPLSPGDRIGAGDLVERSVALDGGESLYLGPADLPDDGVLVSRPVSAGELVPRAAAGSVDALTATVLALRLPAPVSAAIMSGDVVDIWSSPAVRDRGAAGFDPPIVLVSDAMVVRVVEGEGFVAAGSVTVEVLVQRSRVARLLQAIANDDALAIVPAGLPLESR